MFRRLVLLGKFCSEQKHPNVVRQRLSTDTLQNMAKLPFYQSFKEGVNLTTENKLAEANNHFQKALKQITQMKESALQHYSHILKKVMRNNLQLGRYKSVEENIYSLIKYKKAKDTPDILIFQDYNSLMLHYLNHDLKRAIILGKTLLSEKQKDNISMKDSKTTMFNLGNAYFLSGNYQDAKKKYSQCLQSQPQPQLKRFTLNNLAVACWWHKNPLFTSQTAFQIKQNKIDQVNNDFLQARQLFLQSIQLSQELDKMIDEQKKYYIKQCVQEEIFNPKAEFRSANAIKPMYNLAQFYINNDPLQKMKILYWLQTLLKLSLAHKRGDVADQVLVTLCFLQNDRTKLKEILPQLVTKYKGKPLEVLFNKMYLVSLPASQKAEIQKLKQNITQQQQKWLLHDPPIFKKKYIEMYQLEI